MANVCNLLNSNKTGPRILLGCSGSVATIKVSIIAHQLQQLGASVIIVPTKHALHFLNAIADTELNQIQTKCNLDDQANKKKKPINDGEKTVNNKISTIDSSSSGFLYCQKCAKTYKNLKLFSAPARSASSSNNVDIPLGETIQKNSPISSNVSNSQCDSNITDGDDDGGNCVTLCEWCRVSTLHPGLVIVGDTLEWEMWRGRGDLVLHIELRRWADLFLVAPLSANTMAKMANGLCDNLMTSVVRAWDVKKPLLFCPAMNTQMYQHPITAKHIATLKEFGYSEVAAISKRLMCGDVGCGAMAEVDTIVTTVCSTLEQ